MRERRSAARARRRRSGEGRVGEVDADQLVHGVVAIGGDGERHPAGLGGEVAVVIIGVVEPVALDEPVGHAGDPPGGVFE